MLGALYKLGSGDPELCRIIYYTASGYAQFVQFGREQHAIKLMLEAFGNDVEKEAMGEWSLAEVPVTPAFAAFKLKDFKLGSANVEAAPLLASLKKAAGPEPTTNNSSAHANAVWINHFASTASNAIASAIESTVQSFGESLSTNTLQNEINRFFTGVSTALATTFKESFQSLVAVERRSKLLWWKETLYSTTLRKGYREIDREILPVVMALDLARLLPDSTPVSVDYLLTDTYRAVVGGASEKQALPELLAPFNEEEFQKQLAPHLPLMTDCGERTTLTAFLAQVVHDQRQPKKLGTYTGLRAEERATAEQLAVLVLHDLLTERLIKEADAA